MNWIDHGFNDCYCDKVSFQPYEEFCTVPQCSRSSNKNGDNFDVFMILAKSRFKSVLESN